MTDDSRGISRPRSYYSSSGSREGNSITHKSALFQDENHHVVETSSMSLGLDHNNLMPQHSSHRQYKYDEDNDDDGASLLSFQKIKDERDYDLLSYTRKRSNDEERTKLYHQVRTSSPDRGGGGGGRSNYEDDYQTYNDEKYGKHHGNNGMRRQSILSRQSRISNESSTISYIDYNDSFKDNKHDDLRISRQRYSSGRSSRSQSPSVSGDRLGSTIRTDVSSTGTSAITFDDFGYSQSQPSYPRQHNRQQHQQPFVGHDGNLVEHTKYRSDDDFSTMSKPQVPIDITVPSPDKLATKTPLDTDHHRTHSGRELKKPPYSSSSLMNVHEMGSRRQGSKRRSTSKSKASSRNMEKKGSRRSRSRSSSTSKQSRSSDGKRSSSSKSIKSKSNRRRSKDSSHSGSGSGSSKSRRKSRSRNGSHHDKQHRSRRGDLKRERSTRHLESNDDIDQRSAKSGTSDKDRRQRDRRRDMMTGRATKHLLDDDKSTYSRSSVRYDVDDEGYCMHHPEIELMRMRPDGFWSTVRKKCPECIYEDCPSLMGDAEEDDEIQDSTHRSTATPASNDESIAARAILNSTRLFSFQNIMSPEDIEKEEELNRLKRRLAARAYHFPGNSWWQDWMQYLSNTHTVLGLFFHQ